VNNEIGIEGRRIDVFANGHSATRAALGPADEEHQLNFATGLTVS